MHVFIQSHLSEDQQLQWEIFLSRCRHSHPRQHVSFAAIELAKNRVPIFALGVVNDEIVAVGLFSMPGQHLMDKLSNEAVCLRGPAFDVVHYGREFISKLIAYFKSQRIGSVRISPHWEYPEAEVIKTLLSEFGFVAFDKSSDGWDFTGLVDLRPSPNMIFSSFSQSTRAQIRKAERSCVSIMPVDDVVEAGIFSHHLNCLAEERGFTPAGQLEFKETFERILKGRQFGVLLIAYLNSEFLGGLSVIRGNHTAHASRYALVPKQLRRITTLTVGPSLFWEGIKWAKNCGCTWFDLEGYKNDTIQSSPLFEIHKFKKRFAPIGTKKIGEHVAVCSLFPYSFSKVVKVAHQGKRKIERLASEAARRLWLF